VRRCIVIVEHNEEAREALRDLLEDLGHDVRIAADGALGRDLIVATQPDLALVDLALPEFDGYQLAREIRVVPALAATRLIALTGYGDVQRRALATAAGFDGHLAKPFTMAALDGIIEATPVATVR
jgi:CheY-like chemotaxis protein